MFLEKLSHFRLDPEAQSARWGLEVPISASPSPGTLISKKTTCQVVTHLAPTFLAPSTCIPNLYNLPIPPLCLQSLLTVRMFCILFRLEICLPVVSIH